MKRRALVTGGASGIGRACARRLADLGMQVVTADLSDQADHILDVTSEDDVRSLADELGAIDIVVNSAGILGASIPFLETSSETWAKVIGVNLLGTANVMRHFLPGMIGRGWGRVVNIASIAGKEGPADLAAYSASKAGVLALTKSVGKEIAKTGVLANAVAPGTILTPMSGVTDPELFAQLRSRSPMQREGTPAEVAELVAWLSSDACSFSTGAVYDISGGVATH